MRFLALLALLLAVPAQAEDVLFIDDLGRRVTIPADPQRIVSTDDAFATVLLLELGVVPAGSQGRPMLSGGAFLRSSKVLTGLDFDNTDMQFLGADPIDVEAIVGARPDLIVTLTTRSTPPGQLAQIAPTVVLDPRANTPKEFYRRLARAVGRQAELARMEAQYAAGLDLLKDLVEGRDLTVSVFDATEYGKIALYHTYGAIGEVIRDAGISLPDIANAIPAMQNVDLSPEVLPELDADIVIGTYRDDKREGPQDAADRLHALIPQYCRILTACREGEMHFFPRDIARSSTYAARMMVIAFLIGILTEVPVVAAE